MSENSGGTGYPKYGFKSIGPGILGNTQILTLCRMCNATTVLRDSGMCEICDPPMYIISEQEDLDD